jgi:hypothetical protein
MVEEDERAYHAPLPERQNAPDFEATTQIVSAPVDDQLDHFCSPVPATLGPDCPIVAEQKASVGDPFVDASNALTPSLRP